MNLSVNLRDLQMIVDKSGHTRHDSAHPPKIKTRMNMKMKMSFYLRGSLYAKTQHDLKLSCEVITNIRIAA